MDACLTQLMPVFFPKEEKRRKDLVKSIRRQVKWALTDDEREKKLGDIVQALFSDQQSD